MRRKFWALVLLFCLAVSMCGCFAGVGTVASVHTVLLTPGNGESPSSIRTSSTGLVPKPADPERANYVFNGWYKDEVCTRPFDFETPITRDMTLWAGWIPDYPTITNLLTTTYMKANVTVRCASYNYQTLTETVSSGSGVIWKEDLRYYYCLTNNHVVAQSTSSSFARCLYTVLDCYGNEYEGKVLYKDPEYDLALLRFVKDQEHPLCVIELAEENPQVDDVIVSVGQPEGQSNFLTYGRVVHYEPITLQDSSDEQSHVTFSVIWHDAYTSHGSSGGALLSPDLKLVGLNYAGGNDQNGDFMYGFSVPVEKIREFLDSVSSDV